MKIISRNEIVNEIKGLVAEGKDWCSYDHFRYYKIMLDTDDGDIWIDVFLSTNEWEEYHSNAIHSLQSLSFDRVSGYIDDAIDKLKTAGWTITD